jgi:hypothetical protein
MRRLKMIHTTAFVLVFGLLGPLTVGQDKPDKQEEKPKSGKQDHPSNPEHQKQDKPAKQEQRQQPKGQQEQQKHQSDNAAKQDRQASAEKQQQQDRSNKHQQQIAKQQQEQQREQQRQNDDSAQRQEQVRVQQDRQHQVEGDHHDAAGQQRTAGQTQQHDAWQGDRAQSWQSEHRTWQQRGGYNGYRVPDDRFQNYYGRAHEFRIYSLPVMYVGGHRRFQYGGYWFGLVDPWPEYWSNDWYDRDDVYVDYNDEGYYLYNRRYPRDRISISFYVN